MRDGAVVFDEIHYFETNVDVRVHISGLGKKKNPREFYIGTDGYVREGFLDKFKDKALKVMKGEARANSVFPFMCKLNDEKEVDDPELWELANPMLSEPRSEYAQGLFDTIKEEYEDLADDPSNREEFMTKRMNLPLTDLEKSVAKWEEISSTNQPLPDLEGGSVLAAWTSRKFETLLLSDLYLSMMKRCHLSRTPSLGKSLSINIMATRCEKLRRLKSSPP